MALLRSAEKPLEELSDRALKQRIERGQSAIRELPDGRALTSEERTAALAKAEIVAADVVAGRRELDRRAAKKRQAEDRNEVRTTSARLVATQGQRVLTEAAAVRLQRLGQDVGLKLDPKLLSTKDLDEILELASRIRENPDECDRARLEQLCEQSADAPNFFNERRQRVKEARALATVREEAHVSLLPRRVKYAEPGSVTLPRVAFSWLQTSKGQWSVVDIGVLAAMLSAFEEDRSLVRDSAFEEDADGKRVLACKGALETLRFQVSVDPGLGAANTSGAIKLGRSLERLAANGFLDVRRIGRHRVEVRLGQRAQALREGKG